MGAVCSQSKSRANSLIIAFPAAIFQLVRYRSACKPVDAPCLSVTVLEATRRPSLFEISPLTGEVDEHTWLGNYPHMQG